MKLRIRDNTLRFRLTQTEVEALRTGIAVEAATRFPAGATFIYRLEPTDAASLSARFERGTVSVSLPNSLVGPWAAGTDEGITGQQSIPDAAPLRVSVEKDFACLKPRDPAEDRDAFPHPRSAC